MNNTQISEAATEVELPLLFQPFKLRSMHLKNRVMLSPMGTFSANDGLLTESQIVHYGRFALGGVGLMMVENTSVSPLGRITPGCPGLWSEDQAKQLKRIVDLGHSHGTAVGVQLCHGGRKGSSQRPWHGGGPLGQVDVDERGEEKWEARAPSDNAFDEGWPAPREMTHADIDELVEDFRSATARAIAAGCDTVEMHCAHGYLLHNFLSPLANTRTDEYGGDLAGRMRAPLRIAEAMRSVTPEDKPLMARLSSVDGVDIGWSIEDSVAFSAELRARGFDMIDCSSGGNKLPRGKSLVARTPGFQVEFANRIRNALDFPTVAVGLIRSGTQAEEILQAGKADLIAIGREMLLNPNWVGQAALELMGEAGWSLWEERYGWWLRRWAAQQGDTYGPVSRQQQ